MIREDTYYIKKTLQLAERARGKTSPNPLVGAVVVKKGKILSQAYHKKCGLPHAEAQALDAIGPRAKGATLYLNLEPCSYFGRTPPCVDKIIQAELKRVVISTKDPNPKVFGRSIRKLRQSNIEVSLGICGGQARQLNEVFFKNMEEGMPFVVAKVAQSLDGKITTASGESRWITGEPSRLFSRRLRDNFDAVLIGANTLRKDNPRLNGLRKVPYKIVVTRSLNLPKNSYLFNNFSERLIIFRAKGSPEKIGLPQSARSFSLKATKKGLSFKSIFKKLYSIGITSVFVEGGSETLGQIFEQRLVDKAYFFIAPRVLGGKSSLTSVGSEGIKRIQESIRLTQLQVRRIKDDILIQGYPF